MEYIQLTLSESVIGKKNLLYSQINILDLIKRLQESKKIKDEKLAIKLLIRKKANEAIEELKSLYKLLPQIREDSSETDYEIKTKERRREDLELEIESIRRQIERLNSDG